MYPSPLAGAISLVGWYLSYMSPVVSVLEGPGKEGTGVGQGRENVEGAGAISPQGWVLGGFSSLWPHPACPSPPILRLALPPSPCPFPAALCYFNHSRFWCLILSHPSGTVSSSSSSSSIQDTVNAQVASTLTISQEEVLDPESKMAAL